MNNIINQSNSLFQENSSISDQLEKSEKIEDENNSINSKILHSARYAFYNLGNTLTMGLISGLFTCSTILESTKNIISDNFLSNSSIQEKVTLNEEKLEILIILNKNKSQVFADPLLKTSLEAKNHFYRPFLSSD